MKKNEYVIPKQNENVSEEIKFENVAICDKNQISNKFNEYFIESIVKIKNEIPLIQNDIELKNNATKFKFEQVELRS